MTNQIETLHLEKVIENHSQNMTNKVVVITGTTSGTGFVCAREVAKKDATVVLLNRESERKFFQSRSMSDAMNEVIETISDFNVEFKKHQSSSKNGYWCVICGY